MNEEEMEKYEKELLIAAKRLETAKPERLAESNADPWKHRSSGMQCKSCMWYVRKIAYDLKPVDREQIGRCRRHAPTMNGFPAVYPSDWCGDHRVDENKL